jgi:hypothetical protein
MSKKYFRLLSLSVAVISIAFNHITAQDFFPLTPEIQHLTGLGSSGPDLGNGLAVDREGNTYFVGRLASATVPNFVASNSFGGGASDGFVTRLTRQGDPVWSRFVGGSANDICKSVAIGANGVLYVLGTTSSNDLETLSSPTAYSGGDDAFCAAIDTAGNLLWTAYIGGNNNEVPSEIVVSENGRIMICGNTNSSGDGFAGGAIDGFIAEVDADGGVVGFTYFGGAGADDIKDIVAMPDGKFGICGFTSSADLFTNDFSGGLADAFIAVLDSTLNTVWGRFVGGASSESLSSITVTPERSIVTVGSSLSGLLAGVSGSDVMIDGNSEVFVLCYNEEGALIWSSFVSGSNEESATDIHADRFGDFYLSLSTSSSDMNTLEPLQGIAADAEDAFLMKWSSQGDVLWSTYLGGIGSDDISKIGSDRFGKITIAGTTASSEIAGEIFNAQGNTDAFVSRIFDCFNPDVVIHTEDSLEFCAGEMEALLVACGALNYSWFNGDSLITTRVDSTANATVIGYTQEHCFAESNVISITAKPTPTVEVLPDGPTEFCGFGSVGLFAMAEFVDPGELLIEWNDAAQSIGEFITTDTAGSFSAQVTAPNGCSGSASIEIIFREPPMPVMAAASTSSCINGLPITLIGLPANGVFLGVGVEGSTFDPSTAGGGQHEIIYSAVDTNGCEGISQPVFIDVYFAPEVELQVLDTVCYIDTQYVFQGVPAGGEYFGDGLTDSLFNPSYAGTGFQTLSYTYLDTNGCTSSVSAQTFVNPSPLCNTPVSVAESELNEFQFYPNPADKLLTIRRRVMDSYLIQLYDSRGTLIFSETGRGTQYIDVSSYSAGMYYLRTMDAKGSHSFQLSVQH